MFEERDLKEIGISQYGVISPAKIVFDDEIRTMCEKTSAACMEKHGPVPRLSERFLNAESGAYNIKTPLCLTASTRWKIPLIMMACVEGTRSSKSCVTVCTRSSGCAALPFFSCPTKDAAAAKSAHIQPPPAGCPTSSFRRWKALGFRSPNLQRAPAYTISTGQIR